MRLWTKFVAAIALLTGLSLTAIVVMELWSKQLVTFAFVPRGTFVAPPPLPAGAYADDTMWLARPERSGHRRANDPAGLIPAGWTDPPGAPSRAAVFFVPTTTSFASHHWNDTLVPRDARARDRAFIGLMGSAFNRGTIWAPLYRQAVIGAFLAPSESARAAVDVAYGDVLLAFDTFAAQVPPDRPIVLAGHGQGALLVLRLLRERVAGRALAERVIAVYAIGWPIERETARAQLGVAPCSAPDEAGCLMSWVSFAEPADPAQVRMAIEHVPLPGTPPARPPFVCTNPLTGAAAPAAPATANLGTLTPNTAMTGGRIAARLVPARCDAQGLLLLGKPPEIGGYVLPGNNYSAYDIPLFWANLRADMARREAGWYARIASRAPRPAGSPAFHG